MSTATEQAIRTPCNLRVFRTEANVSRKQLGALVGVSEQQVARYENGAQVPPLERRYAIGDAVGASVRSIWPGLPS